MESETKLKFVRPTRCVGEVEGASIELRNNYLKRHSVNEDWDFINPGSLSAGI